MDPMDAMIRSMTMDDYDQMIALWQASEGVGLDDVDGRPAIEGYLRRNEGISFVAVEADGRIVGAVLCGTDGRRGYMHHLAVAAEQGAGHRRGPGGAMPGGAGGARNRQVSHLRLRRQRPGP